MSIGDKIKSWEKVGLAKAISDVLSNIPSSVEVNTTSDAPPEAYRVANQLNSLRDELELVRHVEPGTFTDDEYSLEDGWPDDPDVPEEAWEQSGQVIKSIAEKAKIAQSNWSALGDNPRAFFNPGRKPGGLVDVGEDNFSAAINGLVDAAEVYLQEFPEIAFSAKKDVAPLPDVDAELGPTTIACDPNLEASLEFETNQAHYIGRLEGEDGFFSSPYLPVRLQPQLSNQVTDFIRFGADNNAGGWNSQNYSILDNDGDAVEAWRPPSEDLRVGVEVPLGFEITVTEIVQSKTGTWVGFITSDPRADSLDGDILNDNTRVLYTKAEYVRIKLEGLNTLGPDPYVSEGIDQNTNLANSVANIKGAKLIEPAKNNNWDQNHSSGSADVRLEYYNFFLHNKKIIGSREIDGVSDGEEEIIYNNDNINNYQSLRYSEGFFYFIVGSAPRKTEAEIINESDEDLDLFPEELEKQKIAEKVVSYEEMRDNAWDNLLEYLGKSQAGVSAKLIANLKENYFIQAARKVNTQTPDPSNEKILFAIRAEYIDSLPKNPRLYKNNFKEGSPFLQGNNYAVSFSLSELQARCNEIAKDLKALQARVDDSNSTVENASQLEYDIEQQIKVVEEMPQIFNEFFHRQAFPLSSNTSALYDIVREGTSTSNPEHLIQIGLKDNGSIGGDVRETVSYVLFSPSPAHLLDPGKEREFTLDYFDPFAMETIEKSPTGSNRRFKGSRSAISLDVALPWLREKFEGEYGSRALHLLLSYESSHKFFGANGEKEKWMDYLVKYMVPPVRIYLSKRLSVDEVELECEEIIRKLNNAGPVLTYEERLLQEKLYNNEDCMAAYYEKFSKATPATSPGMSKRELEKKAKRTEAGGNILDNQYVKILYTGFFNSLDSSSISALIMACLQKKLGIALTAEAICETAILKLVSATGADSVEKTMLANALLAPNSESSVLFLKVYNGAPPFAPKDAKQKATAQSGQDQGDGIYELDDTFNRAPIATSMLLSQKKFAPNLRKLLAEEDGRANLNDNKWWVMEGNEPRVNTAAVEAIKNLEKTGQAVNLIPSIKYIDQENTKWGQPTPVYYSLTEIESERERLKTLGYTKADTDAVMVASGYLMPDPDQYNVVLGDGKASQTPPGGLSGPTGLMPYNYSAVEDARVVEQNAENWLNYMKGTIGLSSVCELIVGDILDGLQNLIKDPGAFFGGGGAGWWDSFVEGLKRQLSPKVPTLKFPDFLSTDNHMGDYGEKLLKTILAMVAQMLGQIVSLLLKNALEQCLEEDSDLGPSGRRPDPGPDIPFPTLEAAALPSIDGLSDADIVAWMKDILDNVSTGQLCALLRGDATGQTLRACLGRTQTNWQNVYKNGINTTQVISTTFQRVGESINIDICNVIDSPTLVNNLCDAIFDRDARCATLLSAGLTKEECEAQINQEIEDLKNRVAGIASLNLLDVNPLANSFPPICGENGSFTIPPGVRDTMNRITDNLLTNVKGSLMIDLEGLKFFSSPPRALLAVADPEELKRTHAAFLELAKKPKTKKCLALIAEPKNHVREYKLGSSQTRVNYNTYPFCYNGDNAFGEKLKRQQFDFGSLGTQDLGINFYQPVFDTLASSELLPLHVGLLNDANAENFEEFSDSIGKKLKGDVKDIVTAYVESKFVNETPDNPVEYLNQQISSEYSKDFKIQQLEALTIFEEQLFTSPLLTTEENDYPRFPGNLDKFVVAGHEVSVLTGLFLQSFRKHKNALSRSWPLNTKLKDIDNRPWTWYYMMIAYTGVNLSIGEDGGGNYPRRNFPNGWLKDYDFWENDMDPSKPDELYAGTNFNPYNSDLKKWWLVYKASPGLRNIVKITRRILLESDKTLFKRKQLNDSSKTREFNLAVGFMELTIAEAAGLDYDRIKEAYPNMQDYFSNPNNAVIFGTYSNPTIKAKTVSKVDTEEIKPAGYYYGKEYYGIDKSKLLTDGYGKPISPAGDPLKYEEEEVVIIKADSITTSEETLTEEFKNTGRWLDYELYYPHFLAFEKIFRDTESSLNAAPEKLIESFSGDGEKVNQHLYDRLNFVPDSMMPENLRLQDNRNNFISMLAGDIEELSLNSNPLLGLNIEKHSPNILKYDLGSRTLLGFDEGLTTEALEALNSPDAFARLQTLADQIDTFPQSLIYQNVLTPLSENKEIQTLELKNVSKLVKGAVAEFGESIYVDSAEKIAKFKEEVLTIDDLEPEEVVALINQSPNYVAVERLDLFSSSELVEIAEKYPSLPISGIIEVGSLFVFDMNKLLTIAPTSLGKTPGVPLTADDKLDYQFLREAVVVDGQLAKYDDEYETSILTDQVVIDFVNSLIDEPGVIEKLIQLSAPKVISSDPPMPPHAIPDDSRISNDTYNFNFAGQLPSDVQALVQSLYPSGESLLDNFTSDYNNLYSETILEDTNYKAQIFGQLLSKKLNDKIQQYLPAGKTYNEENLSNIKKFLSVEGFSGLQYAYSTQMFAKMKASRLQNRKFMKKVWKKILKSPMVSDGIDPRCEKVLEKVGVPQDNLTGTETDFFNIEEIKPKIIELYEKSLCKDVYEENVDGQDSTRTSLMQGTISLVIKIYTLEMCLASVIAWDSFDLEDVFKDTSMAAIILQNISEDFDIEFLSFFATDMLRKENNLTDIQLAELRLGADGTPQSSMEYLIAREAESIATVVKNMFVNSFPLNTNLQVSLIRNSDPDFVEDFAREVSNNAVDYPAYKYASYATGALGEPLEYVSDVRMKDNIYTMNFGSGKKLPYVDALELERQDAFNQEYGEQQEADLFGLAAQTGFASNNNKNYFHSLPMNWYHGVDASENRTDYFLWKPNTWKVDESTQEYPEFKPVHHMQDKFFGSTDCFSFENNVETTHGNDLNMMFGNIVFEPYIKVVDWEEGEERNFVAELYVDENGEPCKESTLVGTFDISDFIEEINDKIDKFRTAKNNVFNCEMRDYVPLSAWSYFYNQHFMSAVTNDDNLALRALFQNYGLSPFFKSISFGMRMSYVNAMSGLGTSKLELREKFNSTDSSTPLKRAKSILVRRPYAFLRDGEAGPPGILDELHIPIVEVEKEIVSVGGTNSFIVGDGTLTPFSELGTSLLQTNQHYIKNPHQFFYSKLANGLLKEIKNSPEFKLMYDYLFPMRRYMAMATIMASTGLSKFISKPTDVLDRTKLSLATIIDNISNSTDYKHLPDPIANLLADRALRAEAGTSAKEPDMTKEILKIVLRTPLLVLKGFVEITDPAIITAKRIIDIANAVAVNTLAAIKQGVATAKRIIQSGIDAARQILQQLEMQLSIGVGFAKSATAALPTVNTSTGPEKLSDYVTIDDGSGNIEEWVLELQSPPPGLDAEAQKQWDDFSVEFNNLKSLRSEYLKNKKKLEDLERKKRKLEEESKVKIRKAENTVKDVYQSPYLLPGIWTAMMPSVIPYGGGINPFPMPLPFVSTFPGMIYLAILFIDAIEEKIHDDMQNTKDPNCEDQL